MGTGDLSIQLSVTTPWLLPDPKAGYRAKELIPQRIVSKFLDWTNSQGPFSVCPVPCLHIWVTWPPTPSVSHPPQHSPSDNPFNLSHQPLLNCFLFTWKVPAHSFHLRLLKEHLIAPSGKIVNGQIVLERGCLEWHQLANPAPSTAILFQGLL